MTETLITVTVLLITRVISPGSLADGNGRLTELFQTHKLCWNNLPPLDVHRQRNGHVTDVALMGNMYMKYCQNHRVSRLRQYLCYAPNSKIFLSCRLNHCTSSISFIVIRVARMEHRFRFQQFSAFDVFRRIPARPSKKRHLFSRFSGVRKSVTLTKCHID